MNMSQNLAVGASARRYLVTVLAALVGTLVSIAAFVAISRWEQRIADLKLREIAGNYLQVLNSDLERATDVLYPLRAYFDNSDTVSRHEFQTFARDLRGRVSGLRNAGWMPRVDRAQRERFEQFVSDHGFPDFEIWQRDAAGNRVRAPQRDEYFPVLYAEEYTRQVLGFDMMSRPLRAAAIARARASGRMAATPPLDMLTKPEPGGFIVFMPVYDKNAPQPETARPPLGYLCAIFDIAPMIEGILRAKPLPPGLDVYLFDPDETGAGRNILWHPSHTRTTPAAAPDEAAMRAGLHTTGTIKIADQHWDALFAPAGEGAIASSNWMALAVLIAGLMLTAAIVSYLLRSLQRTLRLEFLTTSLRGATAELQRESAKVTKLASLDAMTGLANRASFLGQLSASFADARRDDGRFAVICLDLDHFKDVNDTLGHPIGDRLLQIAARRLSGMLKATDLIARLGGDEFAVLLAGVADRDTVAAIAGRLIEGLGERYDLDGNEAHISASLGISVYGPDTASAEAMMIEADLALYRAKSEGRNGYVFHCAELDRAVRERVRVNDELQAALRNGELTLHYQPQVEVPSGRINGLEALVRWNHPRRGLLYPGAFIPIAETTGAIVGIGRFVLEEACRQIKRWQAEGIDPPRVAVNISAAQFKGAAPLDQQLRETLARYDVDPALIEIELTEFALLESTKANSDTIRRVRELGISVAIDDFGTGYSSLEYLRTYRVNRLKIPQQFMTEVAIESGDAAIVRAALVLARELGMDAIAEGVETPEQLAFLLSAGCRNVQGYYFSRPVAVEALRPLLDDGVIHRAPAAPETVRLAV
ncbi:diguanylate cyclase (GGDEF)-like protein [Rhodopseudomonas rhenobacensis]|uniref:Diguanylate cyclase (GGDEF)-like protein n=2 Tax=Rhodopseudomonas rhenobacensis TaxID=87461 RepID=A0A7W7Z492_9BRAD|nr:diguanylate cyclase (GGDEF)-like protein [Rhodopseudomonas rhenobacensis]